MISSSFFERIRIVWKLLYSPLNLIVLFTYESPEFLGYYYLFFSFAGIINLFEGGLGFNLLKILRLNKIRAFEEFKISRLAFFRITYWWFLIVSVIFSLVTYFLAPFLIDISNPFEAVKCFRISLMLISLNFIFLPFKTFLEAHGEHNYVYKFNFILNLISSLLLTLLIFFGFGLESFIFYFLSISILNFTFFVLKTNFLKLIRVIFCSQITSSVRINFISYFLYNYRIAITWSSSILYWNFLPIIIFNFTGPVFSGIYNTTINIFQVIQDFSMAEITSTRNEIMRLKNNYNFSEIMSSFKRLSKRAFISFLLGSSIFLVLRYFDFFKIEFLQGRFIDFEQAVLIFFIYLIFTDSVIRTNYFRNIFNEPFLISATLVNFTIPLLYYIFLTIGGVSQISNALVLHLSVFIFQNFSFRYIIERFCKGP